jgi:hypothetical protein
MLENTSEGKITDDTHSDSDSDSDSDERRGIVNLYNKYSGQDAEFEFFKMTFSYHMWSWVNFDEIVNDDILDEHIYSLDDNTANTVALALLLNHTPDTFAQQVIKEMPFSYFRKITSLDATSLPIGKLRNLISSLQENEEATINRSAMILKQLLNTQNEDDDKPEGWEKFLAENVHILSLEEVSYLLNLEMEMSTLLRMLRQSFNNRDEDGFEIRQLISRKLPRVTECQHAKIVNTLLYEIKSAEMNEISYWFAEMLVNSRSCGNFDWANTFILDIAFCEDVDRFNILENFIDFLCYAMNQQDDASKKRFALGLSLALKNFYFFGDAPFLQKVFRKLLATEWLDSNFIFFLYSLDFPDLMISKMVEEHIECYHKDEIPVKLALYNTQKYTHLGKYKNAVNCIYP